MGNIAKCGTLHNNGCLMLLVLMQRLCFIDCYLKISWSVLILFRNAVWLNRKWRVVQDSFSPSNVVLTLFSRVLLLKQCEAQG